MAGGGQSHHLHLLICLMADFCWLIFCVCAETKYLGTKVPHVNCGQISVLPDSEKKKVTWKDSLFPHHKSSSSIKPLRIWPW
jgi:hypothetical protein